MGLKLCYRFHDQCGGLDAEPWAGAQGAAKIRFAQKQLVNLQVVRLEPKSAPLLCESSTAVLDALHESLWHDLPLL
jgi:hypothetical protein